MRAKLLCTTMGVLVSSTALVGGNAMAADLGMRAPPPPPPIMAQYNWSGAYVGVFGGVTAWDPNLVGDYTYPNYSPPETYRENYQGPGEFGGLVGGDIGYNWQMGSLVYGFEGDFAGVFGGKSTDTNYSSGTEAYGYSAQTLAIGTIRARAGLALDRTLVYLTAGLAEIEVQNRGIATYTGCTVCGYSATNWVPALAVGGGVEYALTNNWTIKAEGLYLAAASKDNHGAQIGSGSSAYVPSFGSTPSQGLLKLGVNYKF